MDEMEMLLIVVIAFMFFAGMTVTNRDSPMSFEMYNTNRKDSDILEIREYLEKNGKLCATDVQLEDTWKKFSEEKYETEWKSVDPDSLEQFMKFINK